jgi:phage terminase large subunit
MITNNIWEGECKTAVDGAIYANEIRDAQENGRITNVPYDPELKVHVVMDLGWNDSMSVILVFKKVYQTYDY